MVIYCCHWQDTVGLKALEQHGNALHRGSRGYQDLFPHLAYLEAPWVSESGGVKTPRMAVSRLVIG